MERGRAPAGNHDACPRGWFVQLTFYLTDALELCARYTWLDSDQRGVTLADVVMDRFNDWYVGLNYYLRSLDLRFQLGAIWGQTRDTVAGAPAEATTRGVRSQVQLQF